MEEKIYITSDIHSDIEALKFIINLASQDNASLLLIAGPSLEAEHKKI